MLKDGIPMTPSSIASHTWDVAHCVPVEFNVLNLPRKREEVVNVVLGGFRRHIGHSHGIGL
jgi:hypothetical protein